MNLILILNHLNILPGTPRGIGSFLSALTSLEFTDALYLLHYMQKAVPIGKGMMIAVLGANIDEINELLNSNRKMKVYVR